ncbi:UNVERIFIED_CONTAM: hypothetical protein GTU68_025116 [Idotea baltica]|nr:hypothetical protein [Idotea baltica]
MQGLFSAPFTPMFDDGSLNLSKIPAYAEMLIRDGVKGVFICGTTGEGMMLSLEERKQVAEAWIPFQAEDFAVMVHVGTNGYAESISLAQHAAEIGAYAIGSMASPFLPPCKASSLVDFCKKIADSVPNIPFYYYHIPSVSGSSASMKEFLTLAQDAIPTLAGIKFSHSNLMEMQQCLHFANGKYDLFHGFDEYLLSGLALGVKAAIGSTYNYMAPIYMAMIQAFETGNMERARELQYTSVKAIENLFEFGGIPTGKAIMRLKGLDVGPPRSPLQRLPEDAIETLKVRLDALDIFASKEFLSQ